MKIVKLAPGLIAAAIILTGLCTPAAAQPQKTDNFVLLIDQSSDMHVNYHRQSKNYIARKNVAKPFIKMVPTNIPVQGAIYMYGVNSTKPEKMVQTIRPMAPFNNQSFLQGLDMIGKQNGVSSLSAALRRAKDDLAGVPGRTAIIVISGGNPTDPGMPSQEANDLKRTYGANVCIYTVLVGKSKRGGQYMRELVDKGGCGLATTSDSLASDADMRKFVNDVFFGGSGDADRDGVPDGQDKCSGTPYGARADARGCWTISAIKFDSGKAVLKSQYYDMLDQIASVMNANPTLEFYIIGHTDADGDESSNQRLSESRAKSVRKYLVGAEVEGKRIVAIGKGEAEPVASNATPDGKAQNRRIEFRQKY